MASWRTTFDPRRLAPADGHSRSLSANPNLRPGDGVRQSDPGSRFEAGSDSSFQVAWKDGERVFCRGWRMGGDDKGRAVLARAKKLVATKHEARLNELLGPSNRTALLAMLTRIAQEF